ncbi:hypothetical protein MJO52_03260 [Microbulbifer variabilis]|uniref:DUF2721 domain-containing protein n=1 Tax=Microbulbifer variabilis TaxID=266805 RepID=A0ABY4VD72_9GAMM|nr:hypothetical protein [Microbulbifer variabilis]USD22169.1 hypothetical protein MJO52_03260 [Microbulbifer variabilis]
MELEYIGSIASIIALILVIFGGAWNAYKKYSAYRARLKKNAIHTRDGLVSMLKNAETPTERSYAGNSIQHLLDILRHKVLIVYAELAITLLTGIIFLQIFLHLQMFYYVVVSITFTSLMCLVNFWYMSTIKVILDSSEWDFAYTWAFHFDQGKIRKENHNNKKQPSSTV